MEDETHTESLRRAVREFKGFGQGESDIVEFLVLLPAKVREGIFLLLDGHYAQDHRAHLKGAKTRRKP